MDKKEKEIKCRIELTAEELGFLIAITGHVREELKFMIQNPNNNKIYQSVLKRGFIVLTNAFKKLISHLTEKQLKNLDKQIKYIKKLFEL